LGGYPILLPIFAAHIIGSKKWAAKMGSTPQNFKDKTNYVNRKYREPSTSFG